MSTASLTFPAQDGMSLSGTLHLASGAPRGAVVFLGAMGVRRRYYAPFADALAEAGFAALTWDYRGIGAPMAEASSFAPPSLLTWAEQDAAGALQFIGERFPSTPRFVVAHSLGGQILGLVPGAASLSAAIFVASGSGDWRLWPPPRRYTLALGWYVVIPALARLLGRLPRWVGVGEIPGGAARQWAAWGRRRGYLMGALDDERRGRYGEFRAPLLAYNIADDELIPLRSVEALLGWYRAAEITQRHLSPRELGVAAFGHFGFFRPEARDLVWPQAIAWLNERGRK